MNTYEFKLYQDTIYEDVKRQTSYEGAKTDATLYDRVRVKSGDKTMLERWWADACGLVTTVLTPYVTAINNKVIDTTTGTDDTVKTTESAGFTITCGLPTNWNTSLQSKLKDALQSLVTDYILQQWYLLLNMGDQANIAQANQQTSIAAAGQILYTRVRPTRPTYEEDIYD